MDISIHRLQLPTLRTFSAAASYCMFNARKVVRRSLVVSQEILKTTDIFVIHHTDCGGQAAVRQHGMLIQSMIDKLPLVFGLLLRLLDLLHMTGLILKPIRDLDRSIIEDVEKLKANPLVPKSIGIYGFLYSVSDGSLKEVIRRLPDRSGKKLQ